MLKEQIEELFLQYRQDLCDTEFAPEPFEQTTDIDLHNRYARKVLALFPQGDKDGLLSPESFQKIYDDFFGEGSSYCNEIDDTDVGYMVAQAQHALDQQHEAQALKEQMERVITDLTKILNQPTDRYIRLQDCYKYVEQLKTKMDKTELLEGENG